MQETKDLSPCCPYPQKEAELEDPDCKHHFEGFEDMSEKEKHRAEKCFSECIFTKHGLLEDGDLVKEEIHKLAKQNLVDLNGEDFQDVTTESINYCWDECKPS